MRPSGAARRSCGSSSVKGKRRSWFVGCLPSHYTCSCHCHTEAKDGPEFNVDNFKKRTITVQLRKGWASKSHTRRAGTMHQIALKFNPVAPIVILDFGFFRCGRQACGRTHLVRAASTNRNFAGCAELNTPVFTCIGVHINL